MEWIEMTYGPTDLVWAFVLGFVLGGLAAVNTERRLDAARKET